MNICDIIHKNINFSFRFYVVFSFVTNIIIIIKDPRHCDTKINNCANLFIEDDYEIHPDMVYID